MIYRSSGSVESRDKASESPYDEVAQVHEKLEHQETNLAYLEEKHVGKAWRHRRSRIKKANTRP